MRKLFSTVGLGILGIDPVTALYIMSMGLRKEKKYKISLFMLTFVGLSVLQGAVLAAVFGTAAADVIQSMTPDDDSPFWAALELAIFAVILVWLLRKFAARDKPKEEGRRQIVNGSPVKYIGMGILFALSCLTDPTYYGVILLGGETRSFFYSLLLMCLWLLVSQFMTFIAYGANQMDLTRRLSAAVDRFQERHGRLLKGALYLVLAVIAVYLLADSAVYLFTGKYLL